MESMAKKIQNELLRRLANEDVITITMKKTGDKLTITKNPASDDRIQTYIVTSPSVKTIYFHAEIVFLADFIENYERYISDPDAYLEYFGHLLRAEIIS